MNTRKKAPKRKNPLEAVRTYKAIERKKENKLSKKKRQSVLLYLQTKNRNEVGEVMAQGLIMMRAM